MFLYPQVKLLAVTRIPEDQDGKLVGVSLDPEGNAVGHRHIGHWEPMVLNESHETTSDGQTLIEFAGRNCYASWDNPGGKTNEDYIGHIIAVGHGSVLEHAGASFLVNGVSRSLTHELVRHRHLSFSQRSQRYVDESQSDYVVPPLFTNNDAACEVLAEAMDAAKEAYLKLVALASEQLKDVENKTERRKAARQAARCVLPNMTETSIVVSGNLRAWRWFLKMRGGLAADAEIRMLACDIYQHLADEFPSVLADFKMRETDAGWVVESPNPA